MFVGTRNPEGGHMKRRIPKGNARSSPKKPVAVVMSLSNSIRIRQPFWDVTIPITITKLAQPILPILACPALPGSESK